MKTTVEIPDELYAEVKSRAAKERRRVRDLMTEALRLLMLRSAPAPATHPVSSAQEDSIQHTLRALDEAQRSVPMHPERAQRLREEVARLRAEGWSREDRP